MGIQNPKNIGGHVKVVPAIIPFAYTVAVNAHTTAKTPSYDRQADNFPQSMTLGVQCGASTGTPDSFAAVATVYESSDNSTFTAYVPPPIAGAVQTGAATTALTAINTSTELDVDISGAKRYIAVKIDPAFVNGTSPSLLIAGSFTFGGPSVEPF